METGELFERIMYLQPVHMPNDQQTHINLRNMVTFRTNVKFLSAAQFLNLTES